MCLLNKMISLLKIWCDRVKAGNSCIGPTALCLLWFLTFHILCPVLVSVKLPKMFMYVCLVTVFVLSCTVP